MPKRQLRPNGREDSEDREDKKELRGLHTRALELPSEVIGVLDRPGWRRCRFKPLSNSLVFSGVSRRT